MLIPLYIFTQVTTCTISLNFSKPVNFTYAKDVIPLTVSQYDNPTTKTFGIPSCKQGKILAGWSSQKPSGGFMLDDQNNVINY